MNYSEIKETLTQYHRDTDDNVVGVGYGLKTVNGEFTDEMSVVFTVEKKLPVEELTKEQLLPKEIVVNGETISTDVVQGKFKLMGISDCIPSFYNWRTVPPTNRNEQRPLDCGISCGNFTNTGVLHTSTGYYNLKNFVGTMGLLAKDNATNSLVGVTNHHVIIFDAFIATDRAITGTNSTIINNAKGDVVTQPNEAIKHGLDFAIGTVKKYYPVRKPGVYPYIYNLIDVALLTLDEGYINYLTSFHQHNLIDSSYPWATTLEINALTTNTLLFSSGRTTGAKGEGITKLRPTQFLNGVTSYYSLQGEEEPVYYNDLIEFVATTITSGTITDTCYDPIFSGDSGSALIADIGGTKKVIGLVFAGMVDPITEKTTSGIACRIDNIATLLNISAWNGEAISYSNPAGTMELTVNGLDDREYIDDGGNRYWQIGIRNV